MYLNHRRYSLINLKIGLLDIFYTIIVVVIASSALSTLVTCRSYNNGLVFYDLHTHGTYLPPTVSVSRGRSLANFKYSDKGSIWSTFGQPCECVNKVCGCCAGLQVEQYKFDQKICANVTFVPDAEEAQLEVYLNEKSSAKYGLSARNPSPFCIPVMMGVPMGMCVQMSNIQMVGNNLNMCMDFVVRLASTDLFEMHFQCMRMGQDGLQYLDKNGQPVLPQSSHDDDYDFFDENSSPLDSDSNADDEASAAEYYDELEKQQQKYEVVELDVKDQNEKELIDEQKKNNGKHEDEELKEQEEQLFQIKSPLTEEIVSQSNLVAKNPIVPIQNSIVKNESEMIKATINAHNVNNLDHGYDDDHDDKVNDDNKVIVATNAPTIAFSDNEDGDSNRNGNVNDGQSDNNFKQNELITKTKATTTTTTTTPATTTYQLNDPIIDEEMPNYIATDNLQTAATAAAAAAATIVNGSINVNSSTADLERDRDSMAQDEKKEKEDNSNDEDNDDEDDEKSTIPSSTATDATEENTRNEINANDEDNEEVNDDEEEDVKDDDDDEEEEEEEHANNDLDDQINTINNESVTSNDNYILNDANANMVNERVNVTANEHKVDINDLSNDLNNGNNDDDDVANDYDVDNDDGDGDEDDGDGLNNVNNDSNVDIKNTHANDDDDDDDAYEDDDDDDSYRNSLNDIENTLTLPQLRSLSSNKFYRYIHRF